MRLMWFQLKKLLKKPSLIYVLLSYVAIFIFLYVIDGNSKSDFVQMMASGMNTGALPFALGLVTISYMRNHEYKDATLAAAKKHRSYALSKISALNVLVILSLLIYVMVLAALGPLIDMRQMTFGSLRQFSFLLLFYALALLLHCDLIAFFTVLFKKVIYAFYALLVVELIPLMLPVSSSVRRLLVLPGLYHPFALRSNVMILCCLLAVLYSAIIVILYRLINRK